MKRISLVTVLLVLAFTAYSQEIITAEKFFDRVSSIYGGVADYIAEVTIKVDSDTMTGTLYYKRPNLIRIDFSSPAEQVICSNGLQLTIYIPQYRVVLIQELPGHSSATIASMASSQGLNMLKSGFLIAYLDKPDKVALEEGSSEMVTKLNLTWQSGGEGFRNLILSINDRGLIRRIEGTTVGNSKMSFDFRNIRINQGLPEVRFRYDPPASANVIDNFLYEPEN